MPQTLNKSEAESRKDELIAAIQAGKIFIYPTDTIYGLGTNALLSDSVQKIRAMKKREERPFSVIVPGKEWILGHCVVKESDLGKYLPGPYTLFLKKKDKAVAHEVNPNDDTLGVRIPDHWFSDIVRDAGVPFVTTSVNVSGEAHMTKLNNAPRSILEEADYVIYEGEKDGPSSQKVDLTLP